MGGIFIGQMAAKISRLFGNRGTNIAGRVALRFDSNVFKKLTKNIDTIILVTGTNGKTTTANLIASIIKEDKTFYYHNQEGANMYTGIIAAMVNSYKFLNTRPIKYAVFEVDEGSIPKVMAELEEGYLIITNFFRDQLDRYGEIDMLVDKIYEAIDGKDFKLIVNADDPFCGRFYDFNPVAFGLSKTIKEFEQGSVTDSKYCYRCGAKLHYTHTFYNQLGHYHCNKCGFKRLEPKYLVTKILDDGIILNGKKYTYHIRGAYNAYNALASISLAKELDISESKIKKGLLSYKSLDGRMQHFKNRDQDVYLNLVKNPAGMNMSIHEALKLDIDAIAFILNDKAGDGVDVSWIWDSDIELILKKKLQKYFVSGTRAYDMAIRLKNMGVPIEQIEVDENVAKAVDKALAYNALILPSYTALNEVKTLIEKKVHQ